MSIYSWIDMPFNKKSPVEQLNLENRYQLLIESIKDYAIYMLTPEGIIASWNPGAQHFKGYTAAEIIGKHFSCFYTPEDQAAGLPARGLQTARTEGKFEAEGWRVRKDGTRFWACVVVDPVLDSTGQLVGFAKITRDMTDQKVARDALRESEERFRFLVRGVTDYAIYMISPEGTVTNWNTGAQRIKGYADEEIIGSHFSRFYTPEDIAAQLPARALETAAREGRFESEGWRLRKDGTRFRAHVVIDPVYDDSGKMIGYAKITRDITEKRKAAEMLEQANAALVQSQKMEAIGRLTGGIAHDFNNLLAGIMGNLDLMRMRISLGQVTELGRHLDAALAATKRSAALTHRLLAFARRQTLAPRPVDTGALVHSLMDLLQRTVGPDITIEPKVQHAGSWTLCDPNQLENALLNLVINARDAMPEGGKVTIRTKNMTADECAAMLRAPVEPGEYVALGVTDTGTGMTPEVMKQAIEPFFTTKPSGEGTGLGLSMVHGFINQTGGHFHIDSEVGQGTTISLFFPRHLPVGEMHAANRPGSPVLTTDNKRRTILLVEDEETVRTTLAQMLAEFGYNTLVAADGPEGLQHLASGVPIDFLVTDIGLPGNINGRELANAARESHPKLKVLFITGYAEQSVIGREVLPAGMQILVKPFAIDTFAATVQGMLQDAPSETRH